jgi:hypothetical protein
VSEENDRAGTAARMRELAAELAKRQGKTQPEAAVYVLHDTVTGRTYIGQPWAAGPEPEAGQ